MSILKHWKKHKTFLMAFACILIMIWISKGLYQWIAAPKETPETPIEVQTVKVKTAPMPIVVETIGSFTAQKEAKLKAPGLGKIQQLLVEGGSWVKQGTLLLSLIPGSEIRAPFDGYLTDWQVKEGELVEASTELVDIVNTDILLLTYRIPEHYAGELDIGQVVEVTVRAFPDKIFKGAVQFIAPIVDKKTHTILMRAEVQNPEQNLWPGMSAHVRHILKDEPQALVVPESCLMLTLEGYELLVVSQGKLERRSVKLGSRSLERVQIVSGVTAEESVLLTRTDRVEEGASVIANDWTGDW